MVTCSCLCGGVTFDVKHDGTATACHCSQCRKQSGHFWASGVGKVDNFKITGDVTWFSASATAKRGFCPTCGSFLFWKHNDESTMSFSLGLIDGASGLKLQRHIFTDDKGDYYALDDGVDTRGQW
ncbi:MAG: GFA family protein [Planktomarina sp.]